MAAVAPSLEKMNDTVQKLRAMVEKMDSYNQTELNQVEDRIRNEFQVVEAMIAYVGRDIYALAQKRRMELRDQNIKDVRETMAHLRASTDAVKEENGTRSDRDTGDGDGTSKPRRAKRKGN